MFKINNLLNILLLCIPFDQNIVECQPNWCIGSTLATWVPEHGHKGLPLYL
jgi:hypothetical protein